MEQEGGLHTFCHAAPNAWHVMGVTLAAGGSLRWFRDVLGEAECSLAKEKNVDPYDILMKEAAQAPEGSDGLFFLPYLSGERTPYPDPNARGAFVGLTVRHKKSHIIRSVVEGVSYSLRDCLELMKGLGVEIKQIRVSGGGARSGLWRQILADVLNAELVTVTSTEGASFGAALLAGVGAGIFKDVVDGCEKTIRISSHTKPNREHANLYDRYYSIYRKLYPPLKPVFSEISHT
jgi:xylulokinase